MRARFLQGHPSEVMAAESPSGSLRLGYQPQLVGLRTIAVLAVVASHTGALLFERGTLGVDVCFVLSAFLITTILIEECDSTKRISLRRFYLRRSLRLLPAFACCLWFLCRGLHSGAAISTENTLFGVPSSVLSISSWMRAFDLSNLGWLGHTWSLSVEEHFYGLATCGRRCVQAFTLSCRFVGRSCILHRRHLPGGLRCIRSQCQPPVQQPRHAGRTTLGWLPPRRPVPQVREARRPALADGK